MHRQYVLTISVGLHVVLDWFLIMATIVIMWSATVTYIYHIWLRFSWPQSQINNNKTLVLWASRVSWVLQEKTSSCSNDSWRHKIWQFDWLDVRNTMLVKLECNRISPTVFQHHPDPHNTTLASYCKLGFILAVYSKDSQTHTHTHTHTHTPTKSGTETKLTVITNIRMHTECSSTVALHNMIYQTLVITTTE